MTTGQNYDLISRYYEHVIMTTKAYISHYKYLLQVISLITLTEYVQNNDGNI